MNSSLQDITWNTIEMWPDDAQGAIEMLALKTSVYWNPCYEVSSNSNDENEQLNYSILGEI